MRVDSHILKKAFYFYQNISILSDSHNQIQETGYTTTTFRTVSLGLNVMLRSVEQLEQRGKEPQSTWKLTDVGIRNIQNPITACTMHLLCLFLCLFGSLLCLQCL